MSAGRLCRFRCCEIKKQWDPMRPHRILDRDRDLLIEMDRDRDPVRLRPVCLRPVRLRPVRLHLHCLRCRLDGRLRSRLHCRLSSGRRLVDRLA